MPVPIAHLRTGRHEMSTGVFRGLVPTKDEVNAIALALSMCWVRDFSAHVPLYEYLQRAITYGFYEYFADLCETFARVRPGRLYTFWIDLRIAGPTFAGLGVVFLHLLKFTIIWLRRQSACTVKTEHEIQTTARAQNRKPLAARAITIDTRQQWGGKIRESRTLLPVSTCLAYPIDVD